MNRRSWIFLSLILAAYAVPAASRLRAPLVHRFESTGPQYGKYAKNLLQHPLDRTKGLLLDTSGPDLGRYPRYQDQFYSHHPPLPAWVMAGLFAALGPEEWVIRLQGHLFAAGCLAMLFLLVSRWYDATSAAIATAVLALLPMFAYYSAASVHQAPTLFFVLAGLWAYTRWLDGGRRRDWILALAFQAFACYSDWPGYYLGLVLFGHSLSRGHWRRGLVFLLANFAVFGFYLLHLYAADPEGLAPLRELTSALRFRSQSIPLGSYLWRESREVGVYFTIAAVVAALGWMVRRRPHPSNAFVFLLPLLALDEIWLQHICYHHDYCSYFLAPFVAVASARALVEIPSRRWAVAAGAAFAAAFLAQSAVVLHRRMTRPVPQYRFSYDLAHAIRRTTAPRDRVLLLVNDMPTYVPFYSERFGVHFNRSGYLHSDRMGPSRRITLDELLSDLSAFDWVVAADVDGASRMRALGEIPRDRWSDFGIEPAGSGTILRLRTAAVEVREADGFLFFRLR